MLGYLRTSIAPFREQVEKRWPTKSGTHEGFEVEAQVGSGEL